MKSLVLVSIIALWSPLAVAQNIGVFADSSGTNCHLTIPYPGGSVTAYVVATIDGAAAPGVLGTTFRIGGLPVGWFGTVVSAGPAAPAVVGSPFAEGIAIAYPTAITGRRVLLALSITPNSPVENVSLVILPHANEDYRGCGFEGASCPQPCPLFCVSNGFGLDCICPETLPATINGASCVVSTTDWSWGEVKDTYK